MLVEVSKHTEGLKEKTLRPNGLPESLIRYDGMLFHIHTSSITTKHTLLIILQTSLKTYNNSMKINSTEVNNT